VQEEHVTRDRVLRGDAFGVYVHWPFCAAKCPYCDFNSHVRHNAVDQPVFVEAYEREIAHAGRMAPGRTVDTIFFGGGTPSLMHPETVERILAAIARHWAIAPGAEITLEANPSSVDAQNFAGYRKAGVNRLSLGAQSFDDAQLRFLGRLHGAAEAIRAIELARREFPRISFDMIYARPGQDWRSWQAELERALKLAADHLSLYQLTIEPGTPFFDLQARGRLRVPDSEAAAELYERTLEYTVANRLPAYEISNHAAPGAECRHNLVYWRYCDYAGIGPGAHGRLTVDGQKLATVAERNPEKWWQQTMVAGSGWLEPEKLSATEIGDEMLLMGLRLAEGVDLARHQALSNRVIDPERVRFLVEKKLLQVTPNGRLAVTGPGYLVLDAIVADLAA
jgi:oxygen-independent coproporphyrinogen-3 oxidase